MTGRSRRAWTLRVAVAAVALGAVAPPAVALAAHAALPVSEEGLELSTDGDAFAPRIDEPLLRTDERIVPGGTSTALLYVRNTRAEDAEVTVVLDTPPSTPLWQVLDVTATAEGRSLPVAESLEVSPAGSRGDQRSVSLGALPVPPGGVLPVRLTFTMDPAAGNEYQSISAPVRLNVTLSERLDGAASEAVDRGPWPLHLPSTGLALSPPVLLAAAGAMAAGLALLLAMRSRRTPSAAANSDPHDRSRRQSPDVPS
ncbi:hypothetical protein [Rathayibacter sp. VKM Ac-2760]|uniref:hypothetical protein n=1 Tax=Rathayibacter sp. VKM Ac-2760 TaxID=2609253 RepID=UPI001318960D|nr:hypothetical protein [Rathayibacter sp. VKM Ac-2760]QHC57521.1 hypothetical protein GSU72_02180 [Rathayibacter sp. VKM Ac-2760]